MDAALRRARCEGLIGTETWADERGAARYAHALAREEWEGVDKLPARKLPKKSRPRIALGWRFSKEQLSCGGTGDEDKAPQWLYGGTRNAILIPRGELSPQALRVKELFAMFRAYDQGGDR